MKFLLPLLALALLLPFATPAMAADGPMTYRQFQAKPVPTGGERLSYGPLPSQFGDLWLPGGAGPHPVLVLVHGGCWQAAIPAFDLMNHMASALRDRGIAVWNVEYRRLGDAGGGYPGTFQDVAAALDHVRVLAGTHALDLSRVALSGHSAGGHLALWAAGQHRLPKDSPLFSDKGVRVTGVVTLAGINDLRDFHARGPAACGGPGIIDQLVDAATRGTGSYADTSPAEFPATGVAQTVISGGKDSIVPASFGRAYAGLAAGAGAPVTGIELDMAEHFELIDPAFADWAAVRTAIIDALERGN